MVQSFTGRQLAGQKIPCEIGINGQATQPFGELVDHEANGNRSRVDRRARRAGADLGLLGYKQRSRIVVINRRITHGDHTQHLGAHAAVDEKARGRAERVPLHAARDDAVHATKDHGFSLNRQIA